MEAKWIISEHVDAIFCVMSKNQSCYLILFCQIVLWESNFTQQVQFLKLLYSNTWSIKICIRQKDIKGLHSMEISSMCFYSD